MGVQIVMDRSGDTRHEFDKADATAVALARSANDQLAEATRDLESAINIQPNFSEAHYWLGRAYLAQGNPKAAQSEFKLAIEQHGGTYAEATFYLGVATEQLATAK
jgi:Tfp pilus assembly protein PilF